MTRPSNVALKLTRCCRVGLMAPVGIAIKSFGRQSVRALAA
jgi:hypothetical protein